MRKFNILFKNESLTSIFRVAKHLVCCAVEPLIKRKAFYYGQKNMRLICKNKFKTSGIIFLLQTPELWNSCKTVFNKLVSDKKVEVYIVTIPRINSNNNEFERNDSFTFCKKFYDNVINAYDEEKKQWFDFSKLNADYLFILEPYDNLVPFQYQSKQLAKSSRICHIPYSLYVTKTFYLQYIIGIIWQMFI